MPIYIKLFFSFFQIGLFSIGGGYAAMPLIQDQVVRLNSWLTMTEFADIITIAEMTPGPIAINASTFVGMRVAGFTGAVAATIGCVTPSCIIVLSLAYFYYKYKNLTLIQSILNNIKPAIVAMIGSAGLSILLLTLYDTDVVSYSLKNINLIATIMFVINIFVIRLFKIDPIYVMIASGIVGIFLF
ncbi:MAG: chromate transporter [Clostridiales bacterium]|nr:chromate transporter [Clostridiales bacterium]